MPTWCDRQNCCVYLVKFSYWSKFHANVITGSGVVRICVYKELTRKPEICNTPVWIFHKIWRLGGVRNTKFGTNFSNKKILNTVKYQVYSFYHFWVIKDNQEECKIPPLTNTRKHTHTRRLGFLLKGFYWSKYNKSFWKVWEPDFNYFSICSIVQAFFYSVILPGNLLFIQSWEVIIDGIP